MLLKPLITEKTLKETAFNRYTFLVEKSATKTEIRDAIKKLFKVDVIGVRTTNNKSLTKRSPRTGRYFDTKALKKAVVTLKPNQSIKYFETK